MTCSVFRIVFEKWHIPISLATDPRARRSNDVDVRARVWSVLSLGAERRDHLPPLDRDQLCYSFEITTPESSSGWFKTLVGNATLPPPFGQ